MWSYSLNPLKKEEEDGVTYTISYTEPTSPTREYKFETGLEC